MTAVPIPPYMRCVPLSFCFRVNTHGPNLPPILTDFVESIHFFLPLLCVFFFVFRDNTGRTLNGAARRSSLEKPGRIADMSEMHFCASRPRHCRRLGHDKWPAYQNVNILPHWTEGIVRVLKIKILLAYPSHCFLHITSFSLLFWTFFLMQTAIRFNPSHINIFVPLNSDFCYAYCELDTADNRFFQPPMKNFEPAKLAVFLSDSGAFLFWGEITGLHWTDVFRVLWANLLRVFEGNWGSFYRHFSMGAYGFCCILIDVYWMSFFLQIEDVFDACVAFTYLIRFKSGRWCLVIWIRFGDVCDWLIRMNTGPSYPQSVAFNHNWAHSCY